MSRCFPFPPPGYEKKATNNATDLLTKEKQKEKKHKKEKRDKEKKDKKDKDGNKDKQRDKKDRKEKHKEKDKKKDKNKDKDKNKILDDRKIKERTENHGGAKIAETSQQNEELKNSKLLEELGRRIRNGGAAGSQKVENCVGADQRTEASHPPLEKTRDKEGAVRRQQRQRESEEGRVFGNEMVQNFGGPDKGRYGGFGISVEKSMDKRAEGKEKNKDKEGGERRKGKHKDRDREKRKKEKDRDKDKEKEKDWDKDKEKEKDWDKDKEKEKDREKDKEKEKEKLKQKGEDKEDKECNKLGESNKKGQINTFSSIQPLSIVSNKSGGNEGNLKKRKEFEMNGFIHENDIRPNKLLRPLSSSHLPVENGKNCHVAILSAPERQGAPDSNTETNKEHKVNGVVEVPHSSIKLKASREACENGESSSAKQPHPDSKYLSQIYSIPKVEEWSAFGEEQEWLFDGERCLQSKPKVGPEASKTIPQVWAEALQIESADICAFPYVIPY